MLKKDLRIKYTKLRNSLQKSYLETQSLSAANQALKLPIWNYDYYHVFLPISGKNEIDTLSLITILQGKDKNIILPKVTSKNTMSHYLLTDSTLFDTSKWGVPEPVDGIPIAPIKIDVVFLPLLAFDKIGNRVGYGKGFYDKFLSECRPNVLKIGLSFFEAEEKIADVSTNDIPMDYCITPHKIYSFTDSEEDSSVSS